MVAVAKNFEAPIKLVFPKDFSGTAKGMLGLGDIVVPGSVSKVYSVTFRSVPRTSH